MSVSRGRIVLIGCLAALGVVVVVVLVGWFFLARWIHQPSPPLDGTRLADDATAAYLDVHLRRDDPGARALVRHLVLATRDTSQLPDDVPGWLRGVLGRIGSRPPTDEEIDRLLPMRLVGTIAGGTAGDVARPLLAVNAEGAGRVFQFIDTMLSLASRAKTRICGASTTGAPRFTACRSTSARPGSRWRAPISSPAGMKPRCGTVWTACSPAPARRPSWLQASLAAMPADAVLPRRHRRGQHHLPRWH